MRLAKGNILLGKLCGLEQSHLRQGVFSFLKTRAWPAGKMSPSTVFLSSSLAENDGLQERSVSFLSSLFSHGGKTCYLQCRGVNHNAKRDIYSFTASDQMTLGNVTFEYLVENSLTI